MFFFHYAPYQNPQKFNVVQAFQQKLVLFHPFCHYDKNPQKFNHSKALDQKNLMSPHPFLSLEENPEEFQSQRAINLMVFSIHFIPLIKTHKNFIYYGPTTRN